MFTNLNKEVKYIDVNSMGHKPESADHDISIIFSTICSLSGKWLWGQGVFQITITILIKMITQ